MRFVNVRVFVGAAVVAAALLSPPVWLAVGREAPRLIGLRPPSPTVAPQPLPAAPEVSALPGTIERLDALAAAGEFNGALLVARGDRVLLRRAYGEADHEAGTPIAPDTRFRIASVSKQFTAAAILRLQDQGVLNVSDPVCRWINPCPAAWSGITLHHLLTHTSGISDLTRRVGWAEGRRIAKTPEELQADSARLPLDFPPGTTLRYSNAGYNLLGDVVTAASGQPFHAFLKAQFFDPLGMRDTGFDDGEQGAAMGYEWIGGVRTPQPVSNASLVYAAGGLYSTLDDLHVWTRALHHGGVLSPQAYARMTSPHAMPERRAGARFEPSRFGYGLMLADLGSRMDPVFTAEQIYHTGSWAGFRALVVYDPARDVIAVAWTNHYPYRDSLFLATQWAVAEVAGVPLPDRIAE